MISSVLGTAVQAKSAFEVVFRLAREPKTGDKLDTLFKDKYKKKKEIPVKDFVREVESCAHVIKKKEQVQTYYTVGLN